MRGHLPVFIVGLLVGSLAFAAPTAAEHVSSGEIRWACGFGGSEPQHCGIAPVGGGAEVFAAGEVRFDGDPWIAGTDRVVGIEIAGDARAYPVKMLNAHEIVNDVVGGVPVAVTFCPLCGSGVTFERIVFIDGAAQELTFTASGYLWKHDMVMWDPQTESLWTQIDGAPIGTLDNGRPVPRHLDAELAIVPTAVTTWNAWLDRHPDSRLLQPSGGRYAEHAYGNYEETSTTGSACRFGVSGQRDCDVEGLHPKEQIVAAWDPAPVAFPLGALAADGGIGVYSDAAGTRVASLEGPGIATVYDAADRTFTRDASGLWTDQDGAAWDLARGVRLDGSEVLPTLDSLILFWFAWNDHHPDTALWAPAGYSTGLPGGGGPSASTIAMWAIGAGAVIGITWAVWPRKHDKPEGPHQDDENKQ